MPSYRPFRERLWEKIDTSGGPDSCWPFTGCRSPRGYGFIATHRPLNSIRPHRAVYEELVGPIPDGFVVMHHCDNPPCCNPKHLSAVVQKTNVQDAIVKGRMKRRNPGAGNTKIDSATAKEIKARYECGENSSVLAREYGLERRQIWRIGTGRSSLYPEQRPNRVANYDGPIRPVEDQYG